MIDIPSVLRGSVSAEAIQILIELENAGHSPEPQVGALTVFGHTVRDAEFYGIGESDRFPRIGLIGRWGVVKIFNKSLYVQCAFEPGTDDVIAFEQIVNGSWEDMQDRCATAMESNEPNIRGGNFSKMSEIASDAFAGLLILANAKEVDSSVMEITSIH